jgi:hypothetical protein
MTRRSRQNLEEAFDLGNFVLCFLDGESEAVIDRTAGGCIPKLSNILERDY